MPQRWVLPHQPNGAMLELIIAAFGLDPARVVRVVGEIGSVGSASIPVGLDRLLRTRVVPPGDRILLASVASQTHRRVTICGDGGSLIAIWQAPAGAGTWTIGPSKLIFTKPACALTI